TGLVRSTIINPARVYAFLTIMPNFYDAHPNGEAEFVGIAAAGWAGFLSRASVILACRQQPGSRDVGAAGFHLSTSCCIIRALDEYVIDDPDMPEFFSDVNPAMIESQMYEGSLYNLPFLWAASGIHYNKRLFDQAGLDYPTDDWTLEDFLTAARAISALGDDIYGYAWPNRQWG